MGADDAPPPLPEDFAAFKPPEPPSLEQVARVGRPPPVRRGAGTRSLGAAGPPVELPEVDDFPL